MIRYVLFFFCLVSYHGNSLICMDTKHRILTLAHDDDQTVALGTAAGEVFLYNTKSECLKTLYKDSKKLSVLALDFKPEGGEEVASGSKDGTIRLSMIKTEQPRMMLTKGDGGHNDMVTSIKYLSKGMFLASASEDNRVIIWDCQTGKPSSIYSPLSKGHPRGFVSLAVDDTDDTLFCGHRNGSILTWNYKTGEKKELKAGHNTPVEALAVNTQGTRLASASTDAITLWDLSSPNTPSSKIATKGTTGITFCGPNNLFSVTQYGTLLQWDLSSESPKDSRSILVTKNYHLLGLILAKDKIFFGGIHSGLLEWRLPQEKK
jgi:WD40 repeat protein